jgi:hypothetical protein
MRRGLALGLALCLLPAAAQGATFAGFDGRTGMFVVPSHNIAYHGQVTMGFSLGANVAADHFRLDPLPAGFTFGLFNRFAAGASVVVPVQREELAARIRPGFTARIRGQFLRQGASSPGGTMELFGGMPRGHPEMGWAIAFGLERWGLNLSGGAGVAAELMEGGVAPQARAGVGMDGRIKDKKLFLSGEFAWQQRFAAGEIAGWSEFSAYLGLRVLPDAHVMFMPWFGVTFGSAAPLFRIGFTTALSSHDMTEFDRDRDELVDWRDNCPFAPEDEDGWEDEDGCPDPDNDGDGILDIEDETPVGEVAVVQDTTSTFPYFRVHLPDRPFKAERTLEELMAEQERWWSGGEGGSEPAPEGGSETGG